MRTVLVCFNMVMISLIACQFSFANEQQKSSNFSNQSELIVIARGPAVGDDEEDFGDCRDRCYEERNKCFDDGKETEVCESRYDRCAASCK